MGIINPVGSGAWIKRTSSIPASSSSAVHTVGITTFRTLRYVFSIYNSTEDKTKSFDFLVNKEGGIIKTTLHNRLGSVSLGIDAAIVGSNLVVTVTNNEIYELQTQFAYLILGRD